MAMTPYSQSPLVISILGTTPQERGLETQQFKAKFDEGLKEFTEWFNATHKTEFELVQTDLATHFADSAAHGIATPPTAFDIAYLNSLIAQGGNANYYYKNKFGEVTIIARYCKSGTSDDIASGVGTILFNLPAGYRPSAQTLFGGKAVSSLAAADGLFQTDVYVLPDGNVVVVTPGSKNYMVGNFNITFVGV